MALTCAAVVQTFVICTVFGVTGESVPKNRTVHWPMELLEKAPRVYDAVEYRTNGVEVAFLEGLPYRGRPTRIFCYYGVPEHKSGEKVPGVVLVHGGLGSAFYRWVKFWNGRGYAAVSMDTCGCVSGNVVGSEQRGHFRHEFAGPAGWGGFDQLDEDVCDQWMYHAVADAVIANSFLRSLPGVDPDRIGITGVSWGGVITCIAASIDDRFRFAAPVYGCGDFIRRSSMWSGFASGPSEKVAKWESLWDPLPYIADIKAPILWLAGTNDRAFSIPSLMNTYDCVTGEKHLAVKVRLKHTHGVVSENAKELAAFADSLCKGGGPLPCFAEPVVAADGKASTCVVGEIVPDRISLVYTEDACAMWEKRKWKELPAAYDAKACVASALLPSSATAFFFNGLTESDLVFSSKVVVR